MNNKNIGLIEGLLFIHGDEGVNFELIQELLVVSESESKQLVQNLSDKYKNDNMSGLEIILFGGNKCRITTKKENSEVYKTLENVKTETKLSTASIETLSIIAYKGPITKAEIENIRGVSADSIIHKLKIRNLIEDAGKSDLPGKPNLYKVSDDFMKYFNINSLDELPKLPEAANTEGDIFERSDK